MPITNNASYIPTMNQFLAHWTQVNAVLSPGLTVRTEKGASADRTAFQNLRNSIQNLANGVVDKLNDQEIARGEINKQKEVLLALINQFNGMLDAYWADTPFMYARPLAPGITDGQEKFLAPVRDMAMLWPKLDAAPAPAGVDLPLTIGGKGASDALSMLGALETAYAAEADAEQNVVLARATRERAKADAYAFMKAYRVAVPTRCAGIPDVLNTLPALTASGGHTPAPVNASAVFQAPDQAKVVYEASTDAALDHYELRGNPGTSYSDDDAVTIATHAPGDALEFLTGFGLTQPGTAVALKVYVVLTTGNEAGSAPMVVERP